MQYGAVVPDQEFLLVLVSLPVSLSPSKERIAAPLLSSALLSNLSGVLMRERTGFEALHASGDH